MSSILQSHKVSEEQVDEPIIDKKTKQVDPPLASYKDGGVASEPAAKRPLSPFMLYCGERRMQLKAERPGKLLGLL